MAVVNGQACRRELSASLGRDAICRYSAEREVAEGKHMTVE